MKWMPGLVTCLMFAALPRLDAAVDAHASRIVVDPDAYVGKAVTITVKFSKLDNSHESWEEQANLKASTMIKFTAGRLGDIKCYVARTQRNMEALAGLTKGKKLILTGTVRRYRTKVISTYDVTGGRHGAVRDVKRTVRGRVRYAFMVESIAQAK